VNRLHALTDGVYAIAMTILVLELHVPDARSSSELIAGLAAEAPSLFGFALSLLIGYLVTSVRDRTAIP
jgi:TMEM175 potassium channel family protein